MNDIEREEAPSSEGEVDEALTELAEDESDEGGEAAETAPAHVNNFTPVSPPDFASALLRNSHLDSLAKSIRSALTVNLPTITDLGIDFTAINAVMSDRINEQFSGLFQAFGPQTEIFETLINQQRSMLDNLVQRSGILEHLARQLAPLAEMAESLPRLFLPPNLRDVGDLITAGEVLDFLEKEGIPLYLIPRAAIGKRLLLAKDHSNRRKVLNDRFADIVDDCESLVTASAHPVVATEAHFIRDGIGALRAGHHVSAQALFTVTLDTLVSRFFPDRDTRRKITNRKKGAPMPDEISDMAIREAFVWLPVWNAHQEFWQHKGDRIPNDYSRHATVHGVSKTQFNKRNCVQALMLASSLIGYADRLARTQETGA